VKAHTSADVATYIARFPPPVRRLLRQLRATIRKAAPKATEAISYRIPAYMLNGPLVYFAGYTRHVGFYPTGSGIEAFKAELGGYTWSRGAVQFPLDQPLPLALVRRMVEHRLQVNQAKASRPPTGRARRSSTPAHAPARRG
jgi:uncharacterized protein YdhG (YjbR/CyaY superfamily)